MDKVERTRKKLTELSDDDWNVAIKKCHDLIEYRVRGRTKSGCHSEEYLGESPFDYYLTKAIDKLYSGAWEWKEQYSFSEQMCRIIGSIISNNVSKYRATSKKNTVSVKKEVSFEDIDYLFSVDFDEQIKTKEREEIYESQLSTILEAVDGNDDMETLLLYIMDGKTNDEICEATNWKKGKLYKVTNKMKNKTKKYITEQSKYIAK